MSQQPSTSPTPPAEGGGPTPMSIGVHFVKTYYKTLSTSPGQCFKFYKPHSYLSHGEGNTPSTAKGFESYQLADRWGSSDLRFDFDGGAIDAQPSANGSILLVATGRVIMTVDGKEERKGFIHTFFLALQELPNKRKTYYVHNDILRFLKDGQEPAEKSSGAEAVKEEAKPAEVSNPAEEKPKEPEAEKESPGGGVEETKEVTPDEEAAPKEPAEKADDVAKEETAAPEKEATVPAAGEKKEKPTTKESENAGKEGGSISEGKKGKRQRGRGKSPAQQQNAPKQQPASKPVPGSWASLVASGSGSTAAAPAPVPTPSKAPVPAEKKESEKETKASQQKAEEKAESSNTKENGKGGKDRPKRDPDNTLVIKNLAENTKESELLAIFEKFAVQTKSKIVSSTISSHRGLAFVDYDSVAPVMAAVEQHGKEPIQLNGRVLEVDQKTAEQRARKMRGGGYRSGSPNNFNRGSGGSGRQNKRDRGSGGGRGGNKGGNRGGGR